VTRLKQKWLNIHNSLNAVFKKQRGQDFFGEDVLFNTFWQLGMGLTHMEVPL